MGHRAQVEDLMLSLLTDPKRPIAQRIGAGQFFLDRVDKEFKLCSIAPTELVAQAELILDEEVEGDASKSDVTKFWALVVRLIDQTSNFIPAFPEEVPTLDNVLEAIGDVWATLFVNEEDMVKLPSSIAVLTKLRDIEIKLKQHREIYGEYL